MVSVLKRIIERIINWYLLRTYEDASCHLQDNIKSELDPSDFPQNNEVSVKIAEHNFDYKIEFGKHRALTNGNLEVFYDGTKFRPDHLDESKRLLLMGVSTPQIHTPLGKAEATVFSWQIPETSFLIDTRILTFSNKNYCLFQVNLPKGLEKCARDDFTNQIIKFPMFNNESLNSRLLSFKDETFCPPTKRMPSYVSAPVCLYDDEKNAVIFSACNDFATNIITASRENALSYQDAVFETGPNGLINEISPEYSYSYLFVFEHGINKCFKTWGNLLHEFHRIEHKSINPYKDLMNSHLGYFTDNGAYYYYFPLDGGTYDETLIQIEKYYSEKELIPFAYYHLDSWWYEKVSLNTFLRERKKDGTTPGGCLRWEPDANVWSKPLEKLSKKLHNKPLTAHSRWFNEKTPYKDKFEMIIEDGWAIPTTLSFWEHIMDIAEKYNIIIYEQDWMQNQFAHFTHLKAELGAHSRWLEDMHDAAKAHNIKIQYCMATPAQVMEAIYLPNVINVRNTEDYQSWKNWKLYYPDFTQNSIFLNALGLWPFLDVFFSGKHNAEYAEEPYPELRAIMSTLGGGPVAVGDPIGEVDNDIIRKITRKDGLIYKPDYPIRAPDLMFIPHETCYVAYTESNLNDLTWYYVVNFSLWAEEIRSDYTLKEIDVHGNFIEYDWLEQTVTVRADDEPIPYDKANLDYQYCVYAPILPNGTALIGDRSKYVTMSSKEFTHLSYDDSSLKLHLENIEGEVSEILIYSVHDPSDISVDGKTLCGENFVYQNNLLIITLEFAKTAMKNVFISLRNDDNF
ncbi:MAG: hypothetical protein R6U96_01370 [Promethearchaeia archaeon]